MLDKEKKKEINFPIDAPIEFLKRIAEVAAATSDALMWAAGEECSPSEFSRIYVNPPAVISVRRLHVHVKPTEPLQHITNLDEFYALLATQRVLPIRVTVELITPRGERSFVPLILR